MRIVVDMDGVIADALAKQVKLYNRDNGTSLEPEDLASLKDQTILQGIDAYPQKPGFFADLLPVVGAIEGVARLQKRHEVFVCTAAMEFPHSFNDKFGWLRRHLTSLDPHNIVYCGHKSIIAADVLIDDSPRHFQGFQGVGMTFDSPLNRQDNRYERLWGWEDVFAHFG